MTNKNVTVLLRETVQKSQLNLGGIIMAKIIIDATQDTPQVQEAKKSEAEFIATLLDAKVILITSKGEIVYEGGKHDAVAQTSKRPPDDGIW